MAAALEARVDEILEANERDMQAGVDNDIGSALLDRLELTKRGWPGSPRTCGHPRPAGPVGETIEGRRLPNGLDLRRVRVPLGVVAVVYEARPM